MVIPFVCAVLVAAVALALLIQRTRQLNAARDALVLSSKARGRLGRQLSDSRQENLRARQAARTIFRAP